MADDKGLLNLADAIEGLRGELASAIEKGNAQRARMRFRVTEPVVLEVQAVATRVGQGKVGWKVVEVGGSYTAANTHKITVQLTPEWWDGKKGEYTQDFLISATLPAAAGAEGSDPAVDAGTVGESQPQRLPDLDNE